MKKWIFLADPFEILGIWYKHIIYGLCCLLYDKTHIWVDTGIHLNMVWFPNISGQNANWFIISYPFDWVITDVSFRAINKTMCTSAPVSPYSSTEVLQYHLVLRTPLPTPIRTTTRRNVFWGFERWLRFA